MLNENEIILPKKIGMKINFSPPQNMAQDLLNLLLSNKKFIEDNTWYWDITDENFSFNLPPTIFTQKINYYPNKNYENEDVNYEDNYIRGEKLSESQLDSIWKTGKFQIPSNKKIPYEWQLSLFTVKGIERINKSYILDMSYAYYFIYHIKSRFDYKNYKRFNCSFPSAFYSFYRSVWKFLNLIIGLPYFLNNDDLIRQKIRKEQLMNFIHNHPEINLRLFIHDTSQLFQKIDNIFQNYWEKKLIEIKTDYYSQDMTENEILTKINQDEKDEYMKFINQNEDFQHALQTYNDLMDYLSSDEIIKKKEHEKEKEMQKRIKEYDNKLKEENYIRYEVSSWKEEMENKYENNLNKELTTTMKNEIQNEINIYNIPHLIYTHHIENENNFEERFKELQKEEVKQPRKILSIYRRCTRPYEVIQTRQYDDSIRYSFKYYEQYDVTTHYIFWRFYLFFIKYFLNIWNYNFFFIKTAFNSSVSLKALFYYTFFTDSDINYETGEIYDCNEAYTYRKTLNNILISIKESRASFEELPDTGFFGKSFTRILNLIYNYFLKLIVLGLLVFILYPIVIICTFILCMICVLISPVIAFISIFLEFLFNSLIYDNKSDYHCLPFFIILIYKFCIRCVFQFILALIFLIFQPIISLVIFLYAQIRFCLRKFYDFIMFYIIKWLAKIPETDTCIAWKVSGPSLFRNRYTDINNSDIISLCIGKIEEMVLNDFNDKVENLLSEPNRNISNKINSVYSSINLSYNNDWRINESINFFKRKLNKQITERRDLYPCIENAYSVKFTKKRLILVKNLITKYLIEFSKVNDINFIYKRHIEFGGKIEKITDYLLTKIFGNNIMESLEDYDEIVYLVPQSKTVLDSIAKKIFEDPYYQDKMFVEDRKHKEKEEIVDFPVFSFFSHIFEQYNDNKIILNLSSLTFEERRNLLGIE